MTTALILNRESPQSAKSANHGISETPFGRKLSLQIHFNAEHSTGESPSGHSEPLFEFDNSIKVKEFDLGPSDESSPDSTFNQKSLSNAGTLDTPFEFNQTLTTKEFDVGPSKPGSPEAPFNFNESIAAEEFDMGASNTSAPDALFHFDQTLAPKEFDVGPSEPGSLEPPFNFNESIAAKEFDIGASNAGTPDALFHLDQTLAPKEFVGPSNPSTLAANEFEHGIKLSFPQSTNSGSPEPFEFDKALPMQEFEILQSDNESASHQMSLSPSPERSR
jgi:hypothetical protein